MIRQSVNGKKICANHIPTERLTSRIYKELSKLNCEKQTTQFAHLGNNLPRRERQTKTTMRYHYTTITMSKHLKTVEITKFWQTHRETGSFVHCYWEYTATLESTPAISCKNKYTLTMQPSNYILGHLHQRNENLGSHRKPVYKCAR